MILFKKNWGVWKFMELFESCKVFGSKWVFKVKYNVDGLVEKYKVRFVV